MLSIASKNKGIMIMTIKTEQCPVEDITDIGLRDGDISEAEIKKYLSAGILSPEEVRNAMRVLHNCRL